MYNRKERDLVFKFGYYPGDHPLPMPPHDVLKRITEGCVPGFHVIEQMVHPDPMISTEFMVSELARTNPERVIELLPIVAHDIVTLRRLYKMMPGYVTRVLAETKLYSNLQTPQEVDQWLRAELELVTEEFAMNRACDAFQEICYQVNPYHKGKPSDLFSLEMTRDHIQKEAPKIKNREKLLKEISPHLTIQSALDSFQKLIDSRKANCSDQVKYRMQQNYDRLRQEAVDQKEKVNLLLAQMSRLQAVVDHNVPTQHWPEVFRKYKQIYSLHGTSFPADPTVSIEPYLEPPSKKAGAVFVEEEGQDEVHSNAKNSSYKKLSVRKKTTERMKVTVGADLEWNRMSAAVFRDDEEEGHDGPNSSSMYLFSPPGVRFKPKGKRLA